MQLYATTTNNSFVLPDHRITAQKIAYLYAQFFLPFLFLNKEYGTRLNTRLTLKKTKIIYHSAYSLAQYLTRTMNGLRPDATGDATVISSWYLSITRLNGNWIMSSPPCSKKLVALSSGLTQFDKNKRSAHCIIIDVMRVFDIFTGKKEFAEYPLKVGIKLKFADMKTQLTYATMLALSFWCKKNVDAQNIFPNSGRTGIYTTTPVSSLQGSGRCPFWKPAQYLDIDSATGNLFWW